jgi:hypothetical protein
MTSRISFDSRRSRPATSPSKAGRGFGARLLGAALFVVLLVVLLGWVGFLGLLIWRAVASLFA